MISNFPITWRAARSIPHPLGWGGRTQFDFIDLMYDHSFYTGIIAKTGYMPKINDTGSYSGIKTHDIKPNVEFHAQNS